MSTALTSSKLWLRLQCQMISGVSEGLLVRALEAGPAIAAKWPVELVLSGPLNSTVKAVLDKQAMQLVRDDDGTIILGYPVKLAAEFWGAVVLRLSERDRAGIEAATKLLKWGEAWLQYALLEIGNEHVSKGIAPAYDVLSQVIVEPTLSETAIGLVNQVASYLSAQRVSVGLMAGTDMQLAAVSFSAGFDSRTPEMQHVKQAMLHLTAAGENTHVFYSDINTESGELNAFDRLSLLQSADLFGIPLNTEHHMEGVLLIEFHSPVAETDSLSGDGVQDVSIKNSSEVIKEKILALQAIAPLLAGALKIKKMQERGVAFQIAERCGGVIKKWFGPGHWVAKGVIVFFFAFALTMSLPTTYRVGGEAVLQGTHKHVVVASQDGYLDKVNARPGDIVSANDVLASMNDNNLRLERRKLISELQQHRHTYNNALANSLRAQAAIAQAQVEQATIKLELIEKQLDRTLLRSPIDGVIVSEDISQSVGAPVTQGERLFEVVTNQQYTVVLYVDEKDIARIRSDQLGKLVLTSLPGQVFEFSVQRITPLSEVREGRNYFRVDADLQTAAAVLRPGMTGSGKVDVGVYRRGWIYFHGILDWFRLKVWW